MTIKKIQDSRPPSEAHGSTSCFMTSRPPWLATEHSHRVLKGRREKGEGSPSSLLLPSSQEMPSTTLLGLSKSSHSSLGFPIFQFHPFIVSYIDLC